MSEDKRCKKSVAHARLGHSPDSKMCKAIDEKSKLLDSAIRDRLCLNKDHVHGPTHCERCGKRTPSVAWMEKEAKGGDDE